MKRIHLLVLILMFGLVTDTPIVCAKDLEAIQPGDLTIVFPSPETAAQRERLLTLKDLNLSEQDMTAILEHARKTYTIAKEYNRDGGETYRTSREIAAGGESFFQNPCFFKMENWKVGGIRIAPFEYSLPGSHRNLAAYARAHQIKGMDRVFQIRLSLNPFCKQGTIGSDDRIKALDAGLHVIFDIWPGDAVLRAQVLNSRQNYLRKIADGQVNAGQVDLKEHIKALTSKTYQEFHAGLLQRLATLAGARGVGGASSDFLSSLYLQTQIQPFYALTSYDDDGVPTYLPLAPDRVTLPLHWVNKGAVFRNEGYFAELKKFVSELAQRPNLTRVALNLLEGSDGWTLSGLVAVPAFVPGVFIPADEKKAKNVFSALFPQELKTVQAVMDTKNQLRIQDVSSSGFYSLLELPQIESRKKQVMGVQIFEKNLFAQVDFYAKDFSIAPLPAPGDTLALTRLLNDVERSSATATSCTTCHTLPLIEIGRYESQELSESLESIFSPEPQSEVRMMGFDRNSGTPVLRSININEVARDMQKMKDYLAP